MYNILFVLVALVLPFIAKMVFPHKISWKEYCIHTLASLALIGITLLAINKAATYDVELWSGQVTSKQSERVSCEHSYQCNCVTTSSTDSKGNTTYTEICQTCYEHSYDVDWVVDSNVGEERISRIDRQGLKEPKRFTDVLIGEPFITERSFTNYIKASPETLFKDGEVLKQGFEAVLPAYPEVYDYYRVNRVFSYGVNVDNTLNIKLNEYMKKWGPSKQANIIAVFVSEKYSQDYFQALKAHWLGGKKNDVIVVTQLSSDGQINWSRVAARSEYKAFETSLEFDIGNIGKFETDKFTKVLDENIMKRFKREDWHKYEYLLEDFTPSTLAIVLGLLFSFMANLGLSFFFYREQV